MWQHRITELLSHFNLTLSLSLVLQTVLWHVVREMWEEDAILELSLSLSKGGGARLLGLYDCLDLFCDFFFSLSFSQPCVSGDVGAFMMGHGQTSVMCLKLRFLPLQKRWFSCEATL